MEALTNFVSDKTGFDKHVKTLTQSQSEFVHLLSNWFSNKRNMLVLITGGPGSGKTYTVIETLKSIGLNAIVMAPTARIAEKISGRTLHSTLRLNWEKGSELKKIESELMSENDVKTCIEKSKTLPNCMRCTRYSNVVVVDEIGMVPFWLTYWVIRYFFDANSKILFIAMGDVRQLKPVKSQYNIFHVDFDDEFETHRIELRESKRFTLEYQKIIENLRKLIDKNNAIELLEYVSEVYPIVENIDKNVLKDCKRVLAYNNKTVDLYNEYYMNQFPGKEDNLYKIRDGKRDKFYKMALKRGCEVVVTENVEVKNDERKYKILNGTVLRFEQYDQVKDLAICFDRSGRLITVPRSQHTHIIPLVPNFAGTIHKFQGETIDMKDIVFNFNGCTDVNLIYTALSRVRSMDQIKAVAL